MCWPVWENPKGVTNLFNRNIKQAPSTCVWKEPAGETKRGSVFARMTPRFPPRNNLSSRRMRPSGGTRPLSPSQCQLTTSRNCLTHPQPVLGGLWKRPRTRECLEFSAVTQVRGFAGHPPDRFPSRLSYRPWFAFLFPDTDTEVFSFSKWSLTRFPSLTWNIPTGSATAAVCREMGRDTQKPPQPSNLRKWQCWLLATLCWSVSLRP